MPRATTLLFVHGTGAREESYTHTLAVIAAKLTGLSPDLTAKPCYWGHLGAKLLAGGKSVPTFIESGGTADPTPLQVQTVLWDSLSADPLYELRLLGLRGAAPIPFGGSSAGDILLQRMRQLLAPTDEIRPLLAQALLEDLFSPTVRQLAEHEVVIAAMRSASDAPGQYRGAVARAIASRLAEQAVALGREPRLDLDLSLRMALIDAIQDELGGGDRALLGLMMQAFMGLGGQRAARRRRGHFSELINPFIGDIIVYQTKGDEIRAFLKNRIEAAGDRVILLAHSLGGIMCADLLSMHRLPNVKRLITVGSQAPLLYEMDSLHSLRYGQPLPEHFPAPWINIYDVNDFLSYVGREVFDQRVIDVPVDNKCTFPASHSMYWQNAEVWEAVANHLPK
jgi:hypothetical protein